MGQEEHILGCNYSGSGDGGVGSSSSSSSRISKKVKQKKAPQRGLGVAQLEKIRLEEQQKMDSFDVLGAKSSQFLPVNCSSNFKPLCSSLPSVSNLNALYGQAPSVPSVVRNESPLISNQLSGNGSFGHGLWPKLTNGNLILGENRGLDHRGFASEAPVMTTSSHELSGPSVLASPIVKQSSHQFQQPLMVNTSPGMSRFRSQMEPPSYQNSCSWSEEDKIAGTKRSYPFARESEHNGCPTYAVSQSDELVLSSNGHRAHVEPRNKEEPLSPTTLPKGNRSGGVTEDNARLSGDFLTLAPPALDPKRKPPLDDSSNKLSKFESLFSQSQEPLVKSQVCHQQVGPEQSVRCFFPTKHQICQMGSANDDSEKVETLDLNLKL
ncbi:uncharacterized protein LOC127254962 isoform X2 [Andrographis paniculata]|uniref:uncharacterized protein LOC127254962 isoform X2 n=1 Tax=Andrographis paniculata TaxID=175694 RepID=UPI0021E927EB|nr:uncharacterized protein LOC127254962 isoform X2 [Andrographis paniculata]